MDAAGVTKGIRRHVWPFLEDQGFDTFTGRNAWRRHSDRVDVVNFQSFGKAEWLDDIHCTTFSFMLNVGCYLDYIPEEPVPLRRDPRGPQEFECHFRRRLHKSVVQPEVQHPEVWYVDPDGVNLESVVRDAQAALSREGRAWFSMFADRQGILGILMSDEVRELEFAIGTLSSPRRYYLTGYVAKALGNRDLATEYLLRAAATPSYTHIAERLRRDAA